MSRCDGADITTIQKYMAHSTLIYNRKLFRLLSVCFRYENVILGISEIWFRETFITQKRVQSLPTLSIYWNFIIININRHVRVFLLQFVLA